MDLQIQDILKLSIQERILMVEKIWDSITPENIEMLDSHKEELDRRLLKNKKGETKYSTWDDVKDSLKNR